MPFLALALNLTWELYNTIQGYIIAGFHISTIINLVWFFLDCGILYTYFKYGNRKQVSKGRFYAIGVIILFGSLLVQSLMGLKLGLTFGALYTSYLMNILMSSLFISMFYKRRGLKGQNLIIAISKCMGTIGSTTLVGIVGLNSFGGRNNVILIMGIIILTLDLVYIRLIVNEKKKLKKLTFNKI
jgi:hypothetical protein